jgi:DNA-binding GntR family transcriptional regulator
MGAKNPDIDKSRSDQVYDSLRDALTSGRFVPGQKLSFRFIAGILGVSLMPVREAIRRLVAEGALEMMRPSRSVRVPLMTRDKLLELRDIRLSLEGLAVEKAAALATDAQVGRLRRIVADLMTVRGKGDTVADRRKIREFHFALYVIAQQPTLLQIIEGLWLRTGPYLNLLYPEFILSSGGPERRLRIIKAVQEHDAKSARREIEADIGEALSYVAGLADASGNIAPALPAAPAKRRRGRSSLPPSGALAFT